MLRKLVYGISILFLIVIGVSFWFYYSDISKKPPIRAKQVFIGAAVRA